LCKRQPAEAGFFSKFTIQNDYGGRSSVGRALVCGTSGRGFKPRRSPHYYFYMKTKDLQRAKGVRDFGPVEKIQRNEITQTLQQVFESFGYNPIETPIIERYELFGSKYGIGNESEAMQETFKFKDQGKRDLVLRTEFTVPFSRFVAMNPQLKKPFKRYQIGQVFRDGPIKLGRYREFWQCDVDVVGLSAAGIDAEIVQLTQEAFDKLGLDVIIKINNRKILNAILNKINIKEESRDSVIVSIDKLDKIGFVGVAKELEEKGLDKSSIKNLEKYLIASGKNEDIIAELESLLGDQEGLEELKQTLNLLPNSANVEFLPSLARGLAYYTGNIFEVFLKDQTKLSSSLAAGGRYDQMIGGLLGSKQEIPAIGISFGLETIFDAMNLQSDRNEKISTVETYLISMDKKNAGELFDIAKELRNNDIKTDICYKYKKLKQGLEFANDYNIGWVIILGEDEVKKNKVTLRNMETGKQEMITLKKAISRIKKKS
jgi:histidyl-tRNA synthetase